MTTVLEPGLPNLQCDFGDYGGPTNNSYYDVSTNNLFTLVTGMQRVRTVGDSDCSDNGYWRFNAQSYNAIYGNSDTVQPSALRLIPQIKF